MPRKQADKSSKRSSKEAATNEGAGLGLSDENDQFNRRSFIRKGGSTRPDDTDEEGGSRQVTDWRVGVVMAVCLPLSLVIFWKFTLPLIVWIVTSIVGLETIQKLGFIKQDIFNMMTSECPMWVPAKERAFLDDRSDDEILRVSNISPADFYEIVRRGEPVIVTDALRDWEGFGLYDCGYFMRKYPEAEYFDWQGQEYVSLGNITNRPGYTGLQCASGYIETDSKSNKKYAKEWMKKMPAPYFLQSDGYTNGPLGPDNEPSVTGFIGMPGTGVTPHLDETCDTIMTAQLSGVKNWSVSWPVKDGDRLQWRKPMVFTMYPGEAMFWYVAMRHHTEVLDGCSLSFSFLLKEPAPTDYFTRLVKDLASVPQAERDALFKETETHAVDYVDKCQIVSEKGKDFIT